MKKVSIIITCFNLEKFIARSISSCIHQSLDERDYEIIVVDDGSTDKSWKIIQGFGNIVRSFRHETNKGVAAASNTGINNSLGEYIVRVDGDDFINKSFIKVLKEVLDHNKDIGFVYCDHTVVCENLERKLEVNTLDKLLDHGAGVMFRKRNLVLLGGYNEQYRVREDYDLILRYFKNFDGYHLRLPYYRYFQRNNSLSSQKIEREEIKVKLDEVHNVKK